MDIEKMILVTENDKGAETNYLLDMDGVNVLMSKVEEQTLEDWAEFFIQLGKSLYEEDWAYLYLSADKGISMSFCKGREHLVSFLNGELNAAIEYDTDYSRCSESCMRELDNLGIDATKYFNTGGEEFKIEVKEVHARVVPVRAASLGDAIERVMDQVKKGEIVLDAYDTLLDTQISEAKQAPDGRGR